MNALAADMESFPVDDRSLSAKADEGDLAMVGLGMALSHDRSPMPSESSFLLADVMYDLVALSKTRKISPYPFVHAYRDYLDRSLRSPHCQGNLPKGSESLTSAYKALNYWLARFAPGIEPVSVPDSEPRVEPDPDIGQYWHSTRAKELFVLATHTPFSSVMLMFNNENYEFTNNWGPSTDGHGGPGASNAAWEEWVSHLLSEMDDWNPADEPDPADYYHQRCILFQQLLRALFPGPLYDRVVSAWATTFADSSLQWDNPPEWYFEVSKFLEFYKGEYVPTKTPAVAIAALKSSSNSSLHALGVLAKFLQ
jgi:hypothetical protein